MIKLYGVPRSRAMRCLWMLEELGDGLLHRRDATARLPGINPNGHIPALDDDGVILWESMAINLYLARKYNTGLWPRTLADEGRAFQWSLWVMTEAEEPVITALLHRRVFPEAQRPALARAQRV